MNARRLAARLTGRTLAFPLLFAAAFGSVPAALPAQNDTEALERLRRDQDEILRKAERLQKLMQQLIQRYSRENKAEQIALLKEGLAHLDRSGILREVAAIRDDLTATAFTEALRKQKEVVDDLERLLNILLERKSVENIDQELQQVEAQARTARELERRQQELIDAARQAAKSEPSAAEQALIEGLQSLRDDERREAERNMRQAGTRRPFLESALERVRELLREQQQLEQGLADEAAGRTPAARAREFDLGDLTHRTRELQGELRDQARTRALGDAARNLQQEAAGADQQALQQARDQLEAGATDAPKVAAGPEGKVRDPEWAKVREQLKAAPAGASEAERQELARIGGEAAELAKQRDQQAGAANTENAGRLEDTAKQLAEKMREQGAQGAPAATGAPKEDAAQAVEQAASRLAEAKAAEQAGDVAKAQQKTNEALSALDRARTLHQQQHPDAGRQAGQMAAESSSTAQELQNAPSAEAAEQAAAKELRAAADALREVEAGVEAGRSEQSPPAAPKTAGSARQSLEAAERALQEALTSASSESQPDMQAAAARQQELQQAAAKAAEQLQRAVEQGQITAEQAQAAAERLQQARNSMQSAQQKLESGQQANAATEQQQAADAVQQAAEALEENRPMSDAQRQQLQQQAKAQEQLTEDIIKLAQELKKRDNKAAQRNVEQASEAARKAQRAMEKGDEDETEQQQEEARQKLEDATKELEEEQERYQDLRQEELLFRMKDELTTFLERQRPITAQTLEAQRTAPAEGLSRAMRIKIRQLGEEEQELAGKIDFLVQALTEEGNLVYQAVLKANHEDLRDVAQRLSVRNPDVGAFTTLLQQEVERRTEKLLEALERERQRRQQQREQQQQQQQQGQPQGQNRFSPQQQKLVSLIAELEMLKQLGIDTRRSADDLRAVVDARGEDVISPTEVALIERLGHRHAEITKLFQQIKQGVEEALQATQGEEGAEGEQGQGTRPGRGR